MVIENFARIKRQNHWMPFIAKTKNSGKNECFCGYSCIQLLFFHSLPTQASNKSQLGRRYSNANLVHRNARLDNSHYYIFIRGNGAYQTNPIHQANVANKYSWYVYKCMVCLSRIVNLLLLLYVLSIRDLFFLLLCQRGFIVSCKNDKGNYYLSFLWVINVFSNKNHHSLGSHTICMCGLCWHCNRRIFFSFVFLFILSLAYGGFNARALCFRKKKYKSIRMITLVCGPSLMLRIIWCVRAVHTHIQRNVWFNLTPPELKHLAKKSRSASARFQPFNPRYFIIYQTENMINISHG